MVDVVRVLQTVADEIGALADDRLTDLARALAGDDERQSELASFLCDALVGQPCQTMTAILVGTSRPGVIVRLFQDEYPWVLVA